MEFKCSECPYKSDRKYCVKKHMGKKNKCCEAGIVPYILEIPIEIKCEYCKKNYSTKSNLRDHLKTCKIKIKQEKRNFLELNEDGLNFIYVLKEREFIKTGERVFKMGFTKKDILARSNGYPKGSKIYCVFPVVGNPELKTINVFKERFTHKPDIGNEYFEGSFTEMFETLQNTLY